MNLTNLTLASTMAILGLVATGCASKNDAANDDNLGTNEALLVDDDSEVAEQDDTLESGIEEPLSGADPSDPGSPAEADDEAGLLAKIKTNPGKWFKPAGCITTTIAGNVATHVFDGCTGPYGFVGFNGTVTSTYVRTADSLTITHAASGFKLNGASVTGTRIVVYSRANGIITKHRTGAWTGTTKNGKPFSHDADFTATWDPSAKCITRDGSAQTSIAARELSLTVDGYKRCGIGSLGCPESGKIVLERTKGANSASLSLEFLGGRGVSIVLPSGRTIERQLVCRPAS